MVQVNAIQDIFNRVIDAGLYGRTHAGVACVYMCNSLLAAVRHEVITSDECTLAQQAIQEYLEAVGYADTLSGALISSDLPHDHEACLAIYRNWANRPRLGVRTEGAVNA